MTAGSHTCHSNASLLIVVTALRRRKEPEKGSKGTGGLASCGALGLTTRPCFFSAQSCDLHDLQSSPCVMCPLLLTLFVLPWLVWW